VPLHPGRLRERGFNQSHLLARHLAATLKIHYADKLLVRHRATQTQSQLDARQRHRNVRKAFQLTQDLGDQHIVLIDDVVTTGATVNEISRLLKSQGAAHVEVWCIARA
jgi:ComF family protein